MKKCLFVVLAVLALAGCGSGTGKSDTVSTSNPTTGAGVDLSGNWTGAAVATNGSTGSANIGLTLSQSGSKVSGTFSSSTGNNGSIVGTVSGSSFSGDLIPSVPTNCPAKIVLIYSNNQLSGTTTTYNCSVVASSNATLSR